jgi:hypothetical protein
LFFFCDTEGDSDWFLYRLCCFFVSVSFVSHFDQMRVMPCREKKMIPWKKSHLRSENIIYLNFCKITNQVIWSDISNTRQNQRLCILQEMGFERWFCMDLWVFSLWSSRFALLCSKIRCAWDWWFLNLPQRIYLSLVTLIK